MIFVVLCSLEKGLGEEGNCWQVFHPREPGAYFDAKLGRNNLRSVFVGQFLPPHDLNYFCFVRAAAEIKRERDFVINFVIEFLHISARDLTNLIYMYVFVYFFFFLYRVLFLILFSTLVEKAS